MNVTTFRANSDSNYYANLRHVSSRTLISESGEKIVEYLPGEIFFQWNKKWKKKPDILMVISYYPVVSNLMKEFLESNNFTGVGFYRAYEIKAGTYSKEPNEQTDTWWVVYPTSYFMIDESVFCGEDVTICPNTKRFVRKNPSSGSNMPWLIFPLEKITTDFFGIGNTPWLPIIFCTEFIAKALRKQRFSNLRLDIVSPS